MKTELWINRILVIILLTTCWNLWQNIELKNDDEHYQTIYAKELSDHHETLLKLQECLLNKIEADKQHKRTKEAYQNLLRNLVNEREDITGNGLSPIENAIKSEMEIK